MTTLTSARFAQLARFCLVGLTCYVVNIAALALLCEVLGVNYVVAYVLVFLLGNALGYWLNKHFTFSIREPLEHAAKVRYLLVNIVALGLSLVALRVLVESMHVWYLAATMIVAAVNTPLTYFAHRFVTYRVAG